MSPAPRLRLLRLGLKAQTQSSNRLKPTPFFRLNLDAPVWFVVGVRAYLFETKEMLLISGVYKNIIVGEVVGRCGVWANG